MYFPWRNALPTARLGVPPHPTSYARSTHDSLQIFSTGLVLSCATLAEKTSHAAVFGNVPICCVENGKHIRGNLPSVAAVARPNTAASSARARVGKWDIGSGVVRAQMMTKRAVHTNRDPMSIRLWRQTCLPTMMGMLQVLRSCHGTQRMPGLNETQSIRAHWDRGMSRRHSARIRCHRYAASVRRALIPQT